MPGAPRLVDLIVSGGTVITVDERRRILSGASVVVDGGRIEAIVPTTELEGSFEGRDVLDATGAVIAPGLVDAHVHLSHHLFRTTLPDHWPESREHDLWLPYWRELSEEDAYLSALLASLEMVRNGTTTFCDMSGRYSGEIQAAAAETVGLRGIVSEVCWDRPPHPDVAIGDADACLARLESLLRRFPRRADRRIWAAVGMSGMGRASDALVVGASELARRSGSILYMHLSFAEADVEVVRAMGGGRPPVEHLDELGVLGPDVQLVHLIRTGPGEVGILARSGTNVVHCPGASVRWGMGAARVGHFPEMLAAGVNVALGSDSGNYSDFLDVGRQMHLAATIHREVRGATPVVAAETALEMATRNGARALGVADEIGAIEVGRQADLVVHDGRRPEWHPLTDPVASYVYAAQSTGVRDVVIGGEIVLRDRTFTRLDLDQALEAIDRVASAVWRRMGVTVDRRWPVTAARAEGPAG
jgi:cytosine/adenosine deaminase-related metal-dependent hydrolase